MRWCRSTPGSAEYILPVTLSTSITTVSPYTHPRSLKMYLEAAIERVCRYTWRLRSSELCCDEPVETIDRLSLSLRWHVAFIVAAIPNPSHVMTYSTKARSNKLREALGGRDRASLEMHLEARIEQVWRCTWRPWSCWLAARNHASLEIHLEAVIERVWRCSWRTRSRELRRCSWRPWLIEFGDALWGCDRASLEIHLQAIIERDWRSTWRRSIWREAWRHCTLC